MSSKFDISAFVKANAQKGMQNGFVIMKELPAKPPKVTMEKLLSKKLDNLIKISFERTNVEGAYHRIVQKMPGQRTIGEFQAGLWHQTPFCLDDFWRLMHLEDREQPLLYPQDCNGSIYSYHEPFNLHLKGLPNLLGSIWERWNGINKPMLYVGAKNTCSSLHLEDMMFFSIFYLHYGANKIWLVVAPADCWKLIDALVAAFPEEAEACAEFYRHKSINVTEEFLRRHDIRYERVIQKPGQIMITFPLAFHQVMNEGFNIGEAVNFATEMWLPFAHVAGKCQCKDQALSIWFDWEKAFGVKKIEVENKRKYCESILAQYNNNDSSTSAPFSSSSLPSSSSSSVPSSSSSSVPQSSFPSTSALPQNPPFYCAECKYQYGTRNEYTRHLQTSSIHCKSNYECNICGFTFTRPDSLTKHLKTHK